MKTHPRFPETAFFVAMTAMLLLVSIARAASVTVSVSKSRAVPGQEMVSTVALKGAPGLGAMHVELVYDDKALELKAIEPGAMIAENCMVETNSKAPGRAIVGFVAQQPIDGDGELFKARFVVRPEAMKIVHKLDLQNVQAWGIPKKDRENAQHLVDVAVKLDPGEIRVVAAGISIWMLGAGALVIVIVVLLAMKKKRHSSTR